jgi:hypothetical protein
MLPVHVRPPPSGPHLPVVLTFVGTGTAVELGVGVGVGVGVRVEDELGIGTGTDEEPGGGAAPPQVPKPGRHPVPQKSRELPQK